MRQPPCAASHPLPHPLSCQCHHCYCRNRGQKAEGKKRVRAPNFPLTPPPSHFCGLCLPFLSPPGCPRDHMQPPLVQIQNLGDLSPSSATVSPSARVGAAPRVLLWAPARGNGGPRAQGGRGKEERSGMWWGFISFWLSVSV